MSENIVLPAPPDQTLREYIAFYIEQYADKLTNEALDSISTEGGHGIYRDQANAVASLLADTIRTTPLDSNFNPDACPVCHSTDEEGFEVTIDRGCAIQERNCSTCGRTWYSVFSLTTNHIIEGDD